MGHLRPQVALAAVVLCLVAVGKTSASPTDEAPAITWEDIRQAAQSHPALLEAASEVEGAAGAVKASRQYPNPVLGFGLGRAEGIDGAEEADIWQLELKLPLLSLGAYRGGIRAAAAERNAAVHEAAATRLEVFRELKEAFLRAAHDQQRLMTLESSAGQLAALVDVARQRVEMGEARPMELSRLEIEAARLDLKVAEAREVARARKQALDLWLGSTLPENFRVEADLSNLPALPLIDDAVVTAVSTHPDVNSAAQRLRAATARLGVERGARFPTIEIGGFYEKELDSRNFGGALEVSVPLWNWNSGRIAQARANEAAARYRRDMRLTEIEAMVKEGHAVAVSAYARARGFKDVILPKAIEVAGAMERMYQIGEVDVMNVLDGRRRLIEIESELLEAYLTSQLAYLRLDTLMGEDRDD